MEKIELIVKSVSQNNSYHISLKIDGSDAGILYLSHDEYKSVVDVLREGCLQKGLNFNYDASILYADSGE
jgi:hypothetical protein